VLLTAQRGLSIRLRLVIRFYVATILEVLAPAIKLQQFVKDPIIHRKLDDFLPEASAPITPPCSRMWWSSALACAPGSSGRETIIAVGLEVVSNPPPRAAAKSVDMGDQGGMALGAWRSMRTRSTMPSWRCSA
jgi:hypothetical protein